MSLPPDDRLEATLLSIKSAKDVNLPELRYWNTSPCPAHDAPKPDCEFQECGGPLFAHQRVGLTWLYLRKKGVLGDLPGLGKTNQILSLAALMKESGELDRSRFIIICQTPSVLQWLREARRWVPEIRAAAVPSKTPKPLREEIYGQDWEILVIGAHMAVRDASLLAKLGVRSFAIDDVDPLLNHSNRTHQKLVELTQMATRCIVLNATPIQTDLSQIHAATVPVGGLEAFGSLSMFERKFLRIEWNKTVTKRGKVIMQKTVVGYKNGDLLKERLAPLYLRRDYDDLTDLRMPVLAPPSNVWLDMHPPQRARYEELRDGVITLLREDAKQVKKVQALAQFTYGAQICAGLPALGEKDGPQASVKLDWLVQQVVRHWQGQKVVVFMRNIGMIKAAESRFSDVGVGTAKIWGQGQSAQEREAEKERFWRDPECRVLLGTSAIERSLNFQNASILVNVDSILNPARMNQLAGRIRRAGSSHARVFIFNLFVVNSQEDAYPDILAKRQAVADFVWEEESELFAKLSASELLSLITK